MDIEQIDIFEYNTVIIGSGAAGLNCALHLVEEGIEPWRIAIVTEKLGSGTSFNTGSDKQTYYKLSIIGNQPDSPEKMAQDMFSGGAMHGDIALVEATNSVREFFHLVQLGVPFPHDKYGAFVGYKTDNDPKQRATSIGPYTSQEMSKRLLDVVFELDINIFDNYYAVKILVEKEESEALGLICFDKNTLFSQEGSNIILNSIKIIKARNIVMATGGPAILYKNSVYPSSQMGTTSLAIEAGCILQNLTESQFGLASTKFRWNVSGSYQQVIPCYFSVDKEGNMNEFLNQYFPSFKELSKAIFLKGYQWPFNSNRIENYGSSLIDLAVYYETEILGREVYLDFMRNPREYNFEGMDIIAKEYLEKSDSKGEIPVIRLKKLNEKAYIHYLDNNIDLSKEPLQITVCNQHLNGGVTGDLWWESNIKHLFAIGEINGSHGIHRPGGSALNSGQVGGLRAAQKIAKLYSDDINLDKEEFSLLIEDQVYQFLEQIKSCFNYSKKEEKYTPKDILGLVQQRMENYACIVRRSEGVAREIENIKLQLENLNNIVTIRKNDEIIDFFTVRDSLLTQYLFFSAIQDYHLNFGQSRGSFIAIRNNLNNALNERYVNLPGNLSGFNFIKSDHRLSNKIQTLVFKNNEIYINWVNVRDVPESNGWFETVWRDYNEGNIIK